MVWFWGNGDRWRRGGPDIPRVRQEDEGLAHMVLNRGVSLTRAYPQLACWGGGGAGASIWGASIWGASSVIITQRAGKVLGGFQGGPAIRKVLLGAEERILQIVRSYV